MKYKAIVSLVTITLFSASPAFALVADVNASSNTDANTGYGGSGSANAGVSIGAGMHASSSDTNGGVHSGAVLDGVVQVTGGGKIQNDSMHDAAGSKGHTEVSGDSNTQISLDALRVSSETDLATFETSMQKSDEHILIASDTNTDVSLSYKQQIKLFGFFPLMVDTTATVDASGKTKVTYPWYAFLAVTNADSLKSDIQASVAPTIHSDASAAGELSASAKAKVLLALRNVMKTHLETSASVNANTSASEY